MFFSKFFKKFKKIVKRNFFKTEHCNFTKKFGNKYTVLKIADRNDKKWKWTKILRTDSVHYTNSHNSICNFLWICWCFRQKSFQFCTPRLKTWQPVLPYYALCIYRCKKKIDFDNFFNPHLPIFVLMGRRTLLNCWKIDELKTEMKSIVGVFAML